MYAINNTGCLKTGCSIQRLQRVGIQVTATTRSTSWSWQIAEITSAWYIMIHPHNCSFIGDMDSAMKFWVKYVQTNRSACAKQRESTDSAGASASNPSKALVFTVIRRHDPVIQNYPKFRSHQITTKPAPHSPWWSIGPPIFDTKHGTKSPGSQVGMENDERKNPRCHAHKTPKKKGVISESCHDLLLASLSLKAWRTGFKGLGGCLLSTHKRTHCPYLHIGVWNKIAVTSWSSRFLKILSFSRMAGEECLGPSSRWAEKLTSELLWTQADAMTQALIPQAVGNSMVWRLHVGWLVILVSSRLQMAASSLT